MDLALIGKALILGIVEGVTEFLPVSSTGHLILAGQLLDFNGAGAKTFHIVIQFGAILAVCWEYRRRIGSVAAGMFSDAGARRFALNVIVATIPAVVLGFLFEARIKQVLFSPVPVAFALVMGGIVILWAQARERTRGDEQARVVSLEELRPLDALKVGIAQCCALIPGVSRSGSTIIGAMLLGFERRVATEFSFFLAIPIIVGATLYEIVKHGHDGLVGALDIFTVGTVAAFASAFVCVRWLLRYVATHDFTVFAWYRIAFGMLVLVIGYGSELQWGA
ncbi:undecaprenyl-diphosphate phosphatase [Trinickia caryophylli]|uniref:Undecaprenyl-diphosphatase n=1 Tax=Trinickia caryophylli TaxID=28094 RepID=A0A1X7CIH1_TRICW|nr:undecaprenyl-diphosphate phosphatase [Trinickia caryophylli]PMS11635.1 undecaprenyl-diphosphate phosphatase [Trinickia caryophylli]TRX19926.1 undecaprenyl-diphosphate phosphatase [Trinickia caryophylli]WQE12739.1 undecaprenyl-diphosphate phosphatase [Trinickia caryophylli]SME97261.1 Undecaprenyl-diphosphatase [Trinickia caryophylli]GLU30446.1 undecaprenyl-diphosphatase 2 [Trinickia caryophylli]